MFNLRHRLPVVFIMMMALLFATACGGQAPTTEEVQEEVEQAAEELQEAAEQAAEEAEQAEEEAAAASIHNIGDGVTTAILDQTYGKLYSL